MAGQKIKIPDGVLQVPDLPIIPIIEGDGKGPYIWASSVKVFNETTEKAFNGNRKSIGKKYLRVKNHTINLANGCPRQPWIPSRNTWWSSRAP